MILRPALASHRMAMQLYFLRELYLLSTACDPYHWGEVCQSQSTQCVQDSRTRLGIYICEVSLPLLYPKLLFDPERDTLDTL
jgi:hypothetical protein